MQKTKLDRFIAVFAAFLMAFYLPIEWTTAVKVSADDYYYVSKGVNGYCLDKNKAYVSNTAATRTLLSSTDIDSAKKALLTQALYGWDSISSQYPSVDLQNLIWGIMEEDSEYDEVKTWISSNLSAYSSQTVYVYVPMDSNYQRLITIPTTSFPVTFQKKDGNGSALSGAKLVLSSNDGSPDVTLEGNSSWSQNLKGDVIYTLREESAPEGYTKTNDTLNFSIIGNAISVSGTAPSSFNVSGNTITVINESSGNGTVTLKKVDADTSETVEGAVLAIYSSSNTKVGEYTFRSGFAESFTESLNIGETYTLMETTTPEGYASISSFEFKMTSAYRIEAITESSYYSVSGTTITVKNAKESNVDPEPSVPSTPTGATVDITFTKTDQNGNNVVGEVGLKLTGETSNFAMTLTESSNTETESLKVGEKYTLSETTTPDGYKGVDDFIFTVTADGVEYTGSLPSGYTVSSDKKNVTVTNNKLTPKTIIFDKVDSEDTTKQLSGATFSLSGSGISTVSWTTIGKEEGQVLYSGIDYILRETTAPEGYLKADSFYFSIDDDGNVISKYPSLDKDYAIDGNKVTIKNTATPDTAPKKTVTFRKVDENGNAVDGVTFYINKGTYVYNRNSLTEMAFKGSPIEWECEDGETYTIEEWQTPAGYVGLENPFTFTVTDGKVVPSAEVEGFSANGSIITITNKKVSTEVITIKKVDENGNRLGNAKFTLSGGGFYDSFTTKDTIDTTETLNEGTTYTLSETSSPYGYNKAEGSFKFTVTDSGITVENDADGYSVSGNTITVTNTKNYTITVKKADENGNYISGSRFELKETGSDDADTLSLSSYSDRYGATKNVSLNKTYTLTELIAPSGCEKIDDTFKFKITSDGIEVVDAVEGYSVSGNTITVINKKKPTQNVIVKKVNENGEALAGTTFKLTDIAADDWHNLTSGNDGTDDTGLAIGNSYELSELTAPFGYDKTTGTLKFTVTDSGITVDEAAEGYSVSGNTITVVNKEKEKKEITVKKVDENGANLNGATFSVTSMTTFKSESINSQSGGTKISLYVGEDYRLSETSAPDGYESVSGGYRFTVTKDGITGYAPAGYAVDGTTITVTNIKIPDTTVKVHFNKVDENGSSLSGAVFSLTGNGSTQELSFDGSEIDKNLVVGKTYTLSETTAPEGYSAVGNLTFTITNDGKISGSASGYTINGSTITIKNTKESTTPEPQPETNKQITFRKVDENGSALSGAVFRMTGTSTDTLIFTGTSITKSLAVGEYTLTETTTPNGYDGVGSFTFNVTAAGINYTYLPTGYSVYNTTSGAVITITNTRHSDTPTPTETTKRVTFRKIDGNNVALSGAVFDLAETTNNQTLQFTGTNISKTLTIGKTYTLTETAAPDGYDSVGAFTFTVTSDGIYYTNLPTGYSVNGMTITIKNTKTVVIPKHNVTVIKTDENGANLSGASFKLYDSSNNEVTTSVTDYGFTANLTEGDTYSIEENAAPTGYKKRSGKIEFTVTSSGIICNASDVNSNSYTIKIPNTPIDYKVTIDKKDSETNSLINGAKLQLMDNGTVVEEWTDSSHTIDNLEYNKEYTIHEVSAPTGYILNSKDITFKFNKDGSLNTTAAISDEHIVVNNTQTSVSITKMDITNNTELAGAKLQIIENGTVVEEWTSTNEKHIVRGLKTNTDYVLHEESAPEGYSIAEDTMFKINSNGIVSVTEVTEHGIISTANSENSLIVEDSYLSVRITKWDITNNKELAGATLQVIKGDTLVDEWVSTTEAHYIGGLEKGTTYTIRETITPNGYTFASDTTFTVNADGSITTTARKTADDAVLIDNKVISVYVSKKDITNNEELAGAALQVLNGDTVVDEWISATEKHLINGLAADKQYVLRETIAPDGYTITADTTFKVNKDGTVSSSATITDNNTIVINNKPTEVKISKCDITNNDELAGATLQILEGDTVVEEWVSTAEKHTISKLKTGVTYTLRETSSPNGYYCVTDTTFTIYTNGRVASSVTQSADDTIVINNEKTKVSISKVDITSQNEIADAKFQITQNGKVVEEWTSATVPHKIEGLNVETEYVLHEETAPFGYILTEDTTFHINKDGTVVTTGSMSSDGTIILNNTKTRIAISKIDISNGNELAGAVLQVLDSSGNVVEEWVSTNTPHEIVGLGTEAEYTLREKIAPKGYTIATDIKFTIDKHGEVSTTGKKNADSAIVIDNKLTEVSISKVDITTEEELEGAKLQVLDSHGNIVEEWVSAKETHKIIGLATEENYTLREMIAPDGYIITEDTEFTIKTNGEAVVNGSAVSDNHILVKDRKTKVSISKVDADTQELIADAKMQLLDSKGTVVNEWGSTAQTYTIEGLLTNEKYTIHETSAPFGYVLANDTEFTIDTDGTVNASVMDNDGDVIISDEKTKVSITKMDINNNKELAGSKLVIYDEDMKVVEEWTSTTEPHIIEGLGTEIVYTIRELVAPKGFTLATDTRFTISVNGEISVIGSSNDSIVINDKLTEVSISKVDITSEEELAGAKLQVIDKNGAVAEEWVSTTVPHTIKGLSVNVEYTLRETTPPDGYSVTTDTNFVIRPDGIVESNGKIVKDHHILVKDRKTYVDIVKVDSVNNKGLAGAKLKVLDKNNKITDEWVSTVEPHTIEGLTVNTVYTIVEDEAPKGYTITKNRTFTINNDGEVIMDGTVMKNNTIIISDNLTEVSIMKTDRANKKPLADAHIQILDGNTVVREWNSSNEKYVIKGLETEKLYTIHEVTAPSGYLLANDTTFTIHEDNIITTTAAADEFGTLLIEDEETVISISKIDVTSRKEIAGARLEIRLDGKVIDSWVSDGKNVHTIKGLKTNTNYVIRETVAPTGYDVITDITFSVDEHGLIVASAPISDNGVILVENSLTPIPPKPITHYEYLIPIPAPITIIVIPKNAEVEKFDVASRAGLNGTGEEIV